MHRHQVPSIRCTPREQWASARSRTHVSLPAGDGVAPEVSGKGQSLDRLKGRVIRREFPLKGADLDTFHDSGND